MREDAIAAPLLPPAQLNDQRAQLWKAEPKRRLPIIGGTGACTCEGPLQCDLESGCCPDAFDRKLTVSGPGKDDCRGSLPYPCRYNFKYTETITVQVPQTCNPDPNN